MAHINVKNRSVSLKVHDLCGVSSKPSSVRMYEVLYIPIHVFLLLARTILFYAIFLLIGMLHVKDEEVSYF